MPHNIQATTGSNPWSGTWGFEEDNGLLKTDSTQELDNFDDDPFDWGEGMESDKVQELLTKLDNGTEIPQEDRKALQNIGLLDVEKNITSPTGQKKSVFSIISAFAREAFQSISDFFTGLTTSNTELTTPVQMTTMRVIVVKGSLITEEWREVAVPRDPTSETIEFI